MRTLSAILTVILFVLIALSFFIHSGAIYTAMGAVFCINVVIGALAKGGENNNWTSALAEGQPAFRGLFLLHIILYC